MPEKIQQIINQIVEKWKSFSVRQRALIVSSVAVAMVAFVILWAWLSAPKMVLLKECANTQEAAAVKKLLEENSIVPEISSDGLVFQVDEKDKVNAELLLAENNITPSNYEWDTLNQVFSGGFSSTEADKAKKYKLFLQQDLSEKFSTLAMVDHVDVSLSIPDNDGTLVSRGEESSALVILTLNSSMSKETAASLGRATATALGNKTTDKITIMDTSGNLLFAGGSTQTDVDTANSNLELKANAESMLASRVKDVILGTELYSNASVSPNLDMDFTTKKVVNEEKYIADGLDSQLMASQRIYSSTGTGGAAAEPGTASNDDTTYVIQDGSQMSQSIDESVTDYDNSTRRTEESTTMGGYNRETSSLAAVMSTYRVYSERVLRESGQLDNMTFAEFEAQNNSRVRTDVDPDLVTMVANATGIPAANISLVAYEVPVFSYDDTGGINIMNDVLPVVLAVLIILLLGYVVFRSTRKEPVPEPEPELSVEALLESTREAEETALGDIGFTEKSEIRILIERFVDENPEAAASLLRNWLNEEWE